MKKMLYKFLFLALCPLWLQFTACKKTPKFSQNTRLSDLIDHRLLKAAGVKVTELPPKTYHPKLRGFVSEFLKDAKTYGVNISDAAVDKLRVFDFVDKLSIGDAPGVMASCNRYFTEEETVSGNVEVNWLTIEVLRKAANQYAADSVILLRELSYHELFHCLLNKGHLPDNVPGIMNPIFTAGDQRARTDWQGLVRDMFSADFLKLIPDAS